MNIKERKFFILDDAKTDELVFFQYKDEAYQLMLKKYDEQNEEKDLLLVEVEIPRMTECKEIQWRIKEVSWEEIFKAYYYKKVKEIEKK